MKQNLTFAVILLAMLSMINATPLHKRKTVFQNGTAIPGTSPLNVAITPDPVQSGKNVTFTISGSFHDSPLKSDPVTEVAFAYATSSNPCNVPTTSQRVCSDRSDSSDTIKCPVTDYNTTIIVQVPADLPTDDYLITVMITDDNYDVLAVASADVNYVTQCPI
ncbi:2512_t:CDS:1 [Funneliformis geosporum]|uniref:Phosphatidylglycerol/phosphatidylinositol transfer protein n=1 Tax=Funneliformis geosporum TaxID=1117311 RepID=A0A9W4WUA6_9GLOM|nr:19866_t:CDS:1 [Funneliformis geosporum]CAI2182065.1 2512_t:CDS:1 [Funneliformis geosporum]